MGSSVRSKIAAQRVASIVENPDRNSTGTSVAALNPKTANGHRFASEMRSHHMLPGKTRVAARANPTSLMI